MQELFQWKYIRRLHHIITCVCNSKVSPSDFVFFCISIYFWVATACLNKPLKYAFPQQLFQNTARWSADQYFLLLQIVRAKVQVSTICWQRQWALFQYFSCWTKHINYECVKNSSWCVHVDTNISPYTHWKRSLIIIKQFPNLNVKK